MLDARGWSVFAIVRDEEGSDGPVRVEASKELVEKTWKVDWADRVAVKAALDVAIEVRRGDILASGGYGTDGHRVYPLG